MTFDDLDLRQSAGTFLTNVLNDLADKMESGRQPRAVIHIGESIVFEISLVRAPGINDDSLNLKGQLEVTP